MEVRYVMAEVSNVSFPFSVNLLLGGLMCDGLSYDPLRVQWPLVTLALVHLLTIIQSLGIADKSSVLSEPNKSLLFALVPFSR